MIERKLEVRVNDESAYIIATLLPNYCSAWVSSGKDCLKGL